MSCWRRYTCDVLKSVDKDLLHEACEELGFDFDEKIKRVANSWGHDDVSAGFIRNGKTLPLGFIFEKSSDNIFEDKVSVTVAGDFYSTGFDEATFVNTLSKLYQKHNVIAKLTEHNYSISNVSVNENEEIEIEAYTYA